MSPWLLWAAAITAALPVYSIGARSEELLYHACRGPTGELSDSVGVTEIMRTPPIDVSQPRSRPSIRWLPNNILRFGPNSGEQYLDAAKASMIDPPDALKKLERPIVLREKNLLIDVHADRVLYYDLTTGVLLEERPTKVGIGAFPSNHVVLGPRNRVMRRDLPGAAPLDLKQRGDAVVLAHDVADPSVTVSIRLNEAAYGARGSIVPVRTKGGHFVFGSAVFYVPDESGRRENAKGVRRFYSAFLPIDGDFPDLILEEFANPDPTDLDSRWYSNISRLEVVPENLEEVIAAAKKYEDERVRLLNEPFKQPEAWPVTIGTTAEARYNGVNSDMLYWAYQLQSPGFRAPAFVLERVEQRRTLVFSCVWIAHWVDDLELSLSEDGRFLALGHRKREGWDHRYFHVRLYVLPTI